MMHDYMSRNSVQLDQTNGDNQRASRNLNQCSHTTEGRRTHLRPAICRLEAARRYRSQRSQQEAARLCDESIQLRATTCVVLHSARTAILHAQSPYQLHVSIQRIPNTLRLISECPGSSARNPTKQAQIQAFDFGALQAVGGCAHTDHGEKP